MNEPASPDKIRRQIIAWHDYRGIGKLSEDAFRKPVPGDGPFAQFGDWILSYDGTELFGVLNSHNDGWEDDYNSFEEMLQAHEYWYEFIDCVSLYLYSTAED